MRGRGKQSSSSFLAFLPSGFVSDTRTAGMGAVALESATALAIHDLYSKTTFISGCCGYPLMATRLFPDRHLTIEVHKPTRAMGLWR